MKGVKFSPEEVIFSVTQACNLRCGHCFVSKSPKNLDIQKAKDFLTTCIQSPVQRIGFSGGEPFLNLEFLIEITKFAVEHDFIFDQIVTNGDWWQEEEDLCQKLQKLYDAGYDGKFALSWDTFHGQKSERMEIFISAVQELFGPESINIQRVLDKGGESLPLARTLSLATPSSGGSTSPATPPGIKVYSLEQTFPSKDKRAWQAKKWFKDDYCQGPGQILYVHTDGNIAPCCGFANENPQLFIGRIEDSYQEIMEKAENNELVKICYQEGLGHYRKRGFKKILKKKKIKMPGKCSDICSFCDYVCQIMEEKNEN
ncbi:MAG: radical SAM protein [Treponema sp.]|nr:radical SAM protein [Treponema sp.]